MPTSINGLGAGAFTAGSSPLGASGVSMDAFLQLLVTQLRNQDPLEPMSNEDFLTQLAQFQSLDEQMKATASTRSLLLAQSLASASALVGKTVTAVQEGYEITGRVDKVVVLDGQVNLVINGLAVTLEEVIEVSGEGEEGD
jgi:flagellar basal-body rod modification protein FlgD